MRDRVRYRPEVRVGRYQDALRDLCPDAVVTDIPYSRRTVLGHNAAVEGKLYDTAKRRVLGYDWWDEEHVRELVLGLAPRTRGWWVVFCDHVQVPWLERAFDDVGRLHFPPLPFVERGSRVRIRGDGPSCWTCQVVVARPRTPEFARWGTLQGAYVAPPGTRERKAADFVVGHKSQWVMREVIRDYTRPRDLVVDPCAGGGSTAVAAQATGRRCVVAEVDPRSALLIQRRIGVAA